MHSSAALVTTESGPLLGQEGTPPEHPGGDGFRSKGRILVVALVVGIVHGLAGSAAVALLVLTTIKDPSWAIAYLLVFGVGTIAGMMLITAGIALPYAFRSKQSKRLNGGLRIASGMISLGFGLFLAYQAGFVNGLFTGHPNWTPR